MPIFFADHTGTFGPANSFMRPIHIGAALAQDHALGPEPDHRYTDTKSKHVSYADLRQHAYLRSLDDDLPECIGIMQNRRFFALDGSEHHLDWVFPKFFTPDVIARELHTCCISQNQKDQYLQYLLTQTDETLEHTLGSATFILNKIRFLSSTIEQQYLRDITRLYPNDPQYHAIWQDAKGVMTKLMGADHVNRAVNTQHGYFDNCLIARKNDFREYNEFLWAVLNELKQYQDCFRIYGYLGERIMSVYMHTVFGQNPGAAIKTRVMMTVR